MSKSKKKRTLTLTKPGMRKKRKESLIGYETKRRLLNRKVKDMFKRIRRRFYKVECYNDACELFPLFASAAGKLKKRNIFHKNKISKIMSKAALFKNGLKEKAML